MNSSTDLRTAKHNLELTQRTYQKYMLLPEVRATTTPDELADWHAAYYSSSTLASFQTRYLKFERTCPKLAEPVKNAYDCVCVAWRAYEIARKAEKARLTAKRANVASKAALNARLNLQPGVSLKGVDVGQYEVILKGLEPVRLHVYVMQKAGLERDLAEITLLLAEHGFNADKANPRDYYTHADKAARRDGYARYEALQRRILKWYTLDGLGQAGLREDNVERIESSAKQFALAYVQGYAAKLALKTGEAIANDDIIADSAPYQCNVSSRDLWRNSTATIKLTSPLGSKRDLVFHTQIIWNRSCLGKVFNQYPTRRVA